MPPSNPTPPRFLIGSGEKLTEPAKFVTGPKPEKQAAYSLSEAAHRLAPRLGQVVRSIKAIPTTARPLGEAIALVTLHPEFLAKTLFPGSLFVAVGIRAVDNRARRFSSEN